MKALAIATLMTACLMCAAGAVVADEFIGDNIKNVINQVDSTLASYEAKTVDYVDQKVYLREQLTLVYQQFMDAADADQKQAQHADLLYWQAQLNRLDYDYAKNTQKMMMALAPRVDILIGELRTLDRRGFARKEDFTKHRNKIKRLLGNSKLVLQAARQATAKVGGDSQEVTGIVKILKGLKGQGQGESYGIGASLAEVERTARLLEESIVQIGNFQIELENEQAEIKAANYVGLVDLVRRQIDNCATGFGDRLSIGDDLVQGPRDRRAMMHKASQRISGQSADDGWNATVGFDLDYEIESLTDDE